MDSNLAQGIIKHLFSLADPGGGFQPSPYTGWLGIADSCVASEIAATVYAAEIAQTLGVALPDPDKTAAFLQARQDPAGFFHNLTPLPGVPTTRHTTYNTCVGIRGLKALGRSPQHDPRPWLTNQIRRLASGEKTQSRYSYDFWANAFAALEEPMPPDCVRLLQEKLLEYQDPDTGWFIQIPEKLERNNPMTFHAVRAFRLTGTEVPLADKILENFMRVQQEDGSWSIGGVHGTFDACVAIRMLSDGSERYQAAIRRGAEWALTCRTEEGGFNHFGSTAPEQFAQHNNNRCEMDACYFHTATLAMAGMVPAAVEKRNNWIGWGHTLLRAGSRMKR